MKTKQCNRCEETKSVEEFNWKVRGKKLQGYCKTCQAQYNRQYYQRNREAIKTKNKETSKQLRRRNKQILLEYLQDHPCVDCGITDVRVLEFDHIRGNKLASVSRAAGGMWSPIRILEEIEKCEVRCANCHKIRHHEERQRSVV